MKQSPFYISTALLLITMAIAYTLVLRPEMTVINKSLQKIPLEIDQWQGKDLRMDKSVYEELNADENVFRNYFAPNQGTLNLYIGYYGTKRGGRASHLPQYCYTGQGWAIDQWERAAIFVDDGRGPVDVYKMVIKKGDQRQLVVFWFQSFDQKVMTSGLELNLRKLKNRFLYNRSDGAFVRLSTSVDKDDVDGAFHRMSFFAKALLPLLSQYWPVEGTVSQVSESFEKADG